MPRGNHIPDLTVKNFRDFVEVNDQTGCWLWRLGRTPKGYGQLALRHGSAGYAHRKSYQLFCGPIPEGAVVRHKCDNPPCVNPEHLEIGTTKDNVRDMLSRNGGKGGVTMAQAKSIRMEYKEGPDAVVNMAAKYDILVTSLQRILTGKTHKESGGPLHPSAKRNVWRTRRRQQSEKLEERNRAIAAMRHMGKTLEQVGASFGLCSEYVCRITKREDRRNRVA